MSWQWWASGVVELGGEHDDESRVLLASLSCLIERLKGEMISLDTCRNKSRAAGSFACSSVWRLGRARKMMPDGPDLVLTLSVEVDGILYCRHVRMMMRPEIL